MPRPPIQHHKLILEIPPATQEFLEGIMVEWQKGKAIRAVGEAAKGILSNPALAGVVIGAILAGAVAFKGTEVIDVITKYFGGLQSIVDAKDSADRSEAVINTTNALRDLIRFLSPLGPLTPLP